ncbi:hypothetical protein JMN32_12105 [Fulvivirga sp. 29W222]|uniref:Uncharacterized protein n=1 Tax=Fulvivirga marina TaxID=2494733 RepID=A0A937G236_9BACT|nr:hypothetical protein [Fulvivirga marina]MBL6447056.1 hypothetical protein [Fulvivirga marina]
MHLITIKDETIGGDILNEIKIQIDRESIKIKDLIASRVTAEVNAYNDRLPEYYNGLVKPSDSEQTLNGYKMKKRKKVDAEKQVYIALEAFQANGFFILVDDEQCEDLEQEVLVNENTSISFLKLTPLVGG